MDPQPKPLVFDDTLEQHGKPINATLIPIIIEKLLTTIQPLIQQHQSTTASSASASASSSAPSSFFTSLAAASLTATSSVASSLVNYSTISPSSSNDYLYNSSSSISSASSSAATGVEGVGGAASSSTIATIGENVAGMPTAQTVIVSIILLTVIIGTIIGNVLVCVAVCLVRKLRRPSNYLLVSLAVSDLCVAVLVMPTALIYEVLEEWKFGRVFCDVWVSFDVLSCTASILNLCAISVDRYWAITKPLEYGVKRTPRRMMACVALVWLGAACISLPPLLILGNEHENANGTASCTVCQNFGYQIYATLGSFYIPLTVMLFVYYQIFRAARRIVMDERRAQTRLEGAINGATTTASCGAATGNGEKTLGPTGNVVIGSPHQKKLRFQLAKERKASTTLGIIMSAFTICWLPFFILALVRPFLGDSHQTLSSFFLWLGYANSLLNPIIYATLNRDFRKPFQEILFFRCSSLNIMMREDFYHSQYGEPTTQRVVLGTESNLGARESFL